jgi:adenine deaminase
MRRRTSSATPLGSLLHDPCMAMSFLSMKVIPKPELTGVDLVDVDRFAPVPLFLEGGAP